MALNRDYTTAKYLSTVKDCKWKQQVTRYRVSNHTLTIETGRYRQHSLPKESRICPNCTHGEHFLTSCPNYQEIRKTFYPKFETFWSDFKMLNKKTQLQYLLGEKQDCILLAISYNDAGHKKREESTNQWCAHKHYILNCSWNWFVLFSWIIHACIYWFIIHCYVISLRERERERERLSLSLSLSLSLMSEATWLSKHGRIWS